MEHGRLPVLYGEVIKMSSSKSISIKINRALMSSIDSAIIRALEMCGGKAETYAKKLCPVDTGNLRLSITHQRSGNDTEIIGTAVKYAPYVEFGHHQEVGRYVPAIGKRLVKDFVPGKPYLAPALENHVSEYEQIFKDELGKV